MGTPKKLTAEMERTLAIAKRDGGRVNAGKGEHAGHVERVSASAIRALIKRGLLVHCYSSEGGFAGKLPERKDPPPLAAAARAAGHEPETEEGGRAMMQAITMEHLQHAESVRRMKKFKPGDEIKYTNFTVGGSYEGTAIVSWDHGKRVEARSLSGEGLTLERAKDGSLRRFT
jgi:hypothetical protein